MLVSPSRLRSAIRRRRFQWSLRRFPRRDCPGLVELGSDYGGWVVPADLVQPTWTCYCVGAGSDVSFEVELLKLGPEVRSFDPFEFFRDYALRETDGSPRFSFLVCAVAPEDGPITMYGRQDEIGGSVSGVNLYGVQRRFEKPGRSIPSLMREFGDDTIELLKLDIEGMEYELLEAIEPSSYGTVVLCVEFHPTDNEGAADVRAWVERLRGDGYELVHCKHGTDLTFVAATVLDGLAHP